MPESFLKALQWYVLAAATIIGTSAFARASETESIRPIMIGVLGYGTVYVMSHFWKELRGKLLLVSIAVFMVLTFVSTYVPVLMYLLFGYPVAYFDPYFTWAAVMAVFGIPVMSVVFHKID